MRTTPSYIRGGVHDEGQPPLSGGPTLEGLQSAMGGPALLLAVELAIEEARRDEAKVIQSVSEAIKSGPAEKHADLAKEMAAMVRRIQERLLDRVREIFLTNVRKTTNDFSFEMLAICRMRLLNYFLESKSRCSNASRRFGFEMEAVANKDAIQLESFLEAMNGIFDILLKVVELDATCHRWACDQPRGGE